MKCKNCGVELKGSWMFCPDCGARLEEEFSIFDTISEMKMESSGSIVHDNPEIKVPEAAEIPSASDSIDIDTDIPIPNYEESVVEPKDSLGDTPSYEESVTEPKSYEVPKEEPKKYSRVNPDTIDVEFEPVKKTEPKPSPKEVKPEAKEFIPSEKLEAKKKSIAFTWFAVVAFIIAFIAFWSWLEPVFSTEGEIWNSTAVVFTYIFSIFSLISFIVAIHFSSLAEKRNGGRGFGLILCIAMLGFTGVCSYANAKWGSKNKTLDYGPITLYTDLAKVNMNRKELYLCEDGYQISSDFSVLLVFDVSHWVDYTNEDYSKIDYLNYRASKGSIHYVTLDTSRSNMLFIEGTYEGDSYSNYVVLDNAYIIFNKGINEYEAIPLSTPLNKISDLIPY